jgi:hypothetical protein
MGDGFPDKDLADYKPAMDIMYWGARRLAPGTQPSHISDPPPQG